MIRTIVQLTEEQHRTLKEMAAEYNVSISEMVRQGVDLFVQQKASGISREERIQRALSVSGVARDLYGATDVSVNHDHYLVEIYAGELDDDE
jgi:hypothetical protein